MVGKKVKTSFFIRSSLKSQTRAQMKIQQMAFMLIALMMFFALVGLLVISLSSAGLKEKATELNEKNAMLLVTKLANSPEFSCGDAFDTGSASCIDGDKIMLLKKDIQKYENFWGDVSDIEIRKIYPFEKKTTLCNEGNYPDNCNTIRLLGDGGVSKGNFVALCRKESDGTRIYNKCELAKIFVSYEKVQ